MLQQCGGAKSSRRALLPATLVAIFLATLLIMTIMNSSYTTTLAATPTWCKNFYDAQSTALDYSLCTASLATRRPSWCTFNNFRASQQVTFRDPDIFNCADSRAQCLYKKLTTEQQPMATLTENNLICVKDSDVDNIVKIYKEDYNGNNVTTTDQSTQSENNRCYFVRAVKPLEMSNDAGKQYLLVLTNRFLFIVDMVNEKVVYSYSIIPTTTSLGDFRPFKLAVYRASNNEATIYVISPQQKLLVLKLDTSIDLTVTETKSITLTTDSTTKLSANEFVQDLQTVATIDGIGTATHTAVLSYGSSSATNGIIIYKGGSLYKWAFKDQTEERKIFVFAHGQFDGTNYATSLDCHKVSVSRPLILIQSKSQINLLQIDGQTIDSAVDLANKKSIIYTHDVSGESIYSSSAFTECFGTITTDKKSQSVWVSVGVASSTSTTNQFNPRVIVFNLPEIASKTVTNTIADPNEIYSATGLDTSCSASYSSSSKPQYMKGSTCSSRPIKEAELTTKSAVPSKIVVGMYKTSDTSSVDYPSIYYHTINVATRESIEVFSFQEFACQDSATFNSFLMPQTALLNSDGKITDIYLSDNAQHLFAVLSRKAFDIDARTRLQDICTLLSSSSPPASLAKFADACKKYPTKYTAFDFIAYFSMCNGGWTCPRFGDAGKLVTGTVTGYANVVTISAGFHTVRPTAVYECEKGFYCPLNNEGRRRICPTGFKCDTVKMLAPVACSPSNTFETTCGVEGSQVEQTCPEGQICVNAMASIPVPPGFVTKKARSQLYTCRNGQYCPLSTQGVDTATGSVIVNACPVLNYCETPYSITPIPCLEQIGNRTQYCPAGTYGTDEHYCPEGHYCPTLSTKVLCEDGYYCPRGTKEPLACTSGYYCPNTNSMLLCPSGYHCAAGSTYPKRCQWFSYCPEGSVKQQSFYLGILLMFLVVFLVLVTFVVVRCVTASYKKKKMKQKKIKQDQEISGQNGLANIGINIANFIQGNEQFNYDSTGSLINEPPFSKKNFTIDYAFEDVSYVRKKSEEVIFEGTTGRVYHGRTTCIIGVNTEAITGLLNVLAGRHHLGFVHGKILINEQIKDPHEFRNIISFAPKQLDMAKELKVHELLRFAGHSRLPSYFTYSQVGRRVEKTCKVLGIENFMYDTIGKSKKHGLDDELRVFVNMALEMVADPVCLFVDNPFDEIPIERKKFLCKALKLAADSGSTVVSTMVRPRNDVFLMFDDCIIMGKNGGIVYNGPTKDALRFFEEIGFKCPNYENPPDFFIDVCLGNVERPGDPNFEPERLLHLWDLKKEENDKKWLKSRNGESTAQQGTSTSAAVAEEEEDEEVGASVIDPQQVLLGSEVAKERQRKPIGFLGQYLLFSLRALLQLSRHYKGVFFDFFFHFALAVIIGGFYFNMDFIGPLSSTLQKLCPTFISNQCSLPRIDKIAPMSIVTVSALAIAAMQSSLKCFGADKELYRREAQNGINKMSYFLGKLTGEIPSLLIYPLVFVTFWYILVNPEAEFYTYYGLFLLFEIVFSSLGYFVSVFVQRTHAEFVGVMYIILCALLGGVQPTVRTMSKEWYTLLLVCSSPVRWAVELMYTVEIRKYQETNQNVATALDNYGFSYRAYFISPIILLSVTCIFLVLSFVGLVMRDPQAVERIKTLTRVYIRKGKRKLKKLKSERKKRGDYVFQQESEIQVLEDGEESESDEDDDLLLQQDEVYQPPSMQQQQE